MLAFIKAMTLSRIFLIVGVSCLIGFMVGGLGTLACSTKRADDLSNSSDPLKTLLSPSSLDIKYRSKLETATFALG